MLTQDRKRDLLAALVGIVAATLGCGEVLDLPPDKNNTGVVDGGGSPFSNNDAGSDRPAGATTGFCSRHPVGENLVVCDDFELQGVLSPWNNASERNGDTAIVNAGFSSAPNALRVAVDDTGLPVGRAKPFAFLSLSPHMFKKQHRRLSFDFTLTTLTRPNQAPAENNTNWAVVFVRFRFESPTRSFALALDTTSAPSPSSSPITLLLVNSDPTPDASTTNVTTPLNVQPPLVVGARRRIVVDIRRTGVGASVDPINVTVDGTPIGGGSTPSTPPELAIDFGGRLDSTGATYSAVFDDVLIEDVD